LSREIFTGQEDTHLLLEWEYHRIVTWTDILLILVFHHCSSFRDCTDFFSSSEIGITVVSVGYVHGHECGSRRRHPNFTSLNGLISHERCFNSMASVHRDHDTESKHF